MSTIMNFLPAGWGKHKGAGEWAGPCPRCGGKDRFVVWPEHHSGAAGGKYMCRGCAPDGGDGIQFLRDFQGMGFVEACEALRVEPRRDKSTLAPGRGNPAWEPVPERVPSELWRRRAAAFLAECREHLSSDEAMEALHGRSLNPDFALKHSIGWNPAERFEAPETWGVAPWLNNRGRPGKMYFPAGLVIPTFRRSGPVAVKIRRRDWQPDDGWPKYHAVKGGGNGALVLGKSGLPVVLVESEADGLLLFQECSDLCSVVALGAVSCRPHSATVAFLNTAPLILVALDFDAPDSKGERAGEKGWRWWRRHFSRARRWPPAVGKDPGEMHGAGVHVRAWVEAGLEKLSAVKGEPSETPMQVWMEFNENGQTGVWCRI